MYIVKVTDSQGNKEFIDINADKRYHNESTGFTEFYGKARFIQEVRTESIMEIIEK